MKCLCKLEIVVVEAHKDCPVHHPKIGRWRCPVCNHWVDQNAGWRITPEEEICGECYRTLKGGEPVELGPDQWVPR